MPSSWTLAADWPAPVGVRALTTTRSGPGGSTGSYAAFNLGDACGDEPAVVADNRQRLIQALRLPSAPCWLRQVHGTTVVRFERSCVDPPQADAAVTGRPGIVLAILSADCLPVLFAAGDGSEIAAAHAGWRGLAAGVLESTLAAMRTPPSRVHAWLGPAIGAGAYEVGEEVRAAFLEADASSSSAFAPGRPGRWQCDLVAIARKRLAHAGLDSVHGGGLCTHADAQRFYSHRRDGRSGRMATLLWVEPGDEPRPNGES